MTPFAPKRTGRSAILGAEQSIACRGGTLCVGGADYVPRQTRLRGGKPRPQPHGKSLPRVVRVRRVCAATRGPPA